MWCGGCGQGVVARAEAKGGAREEGEGEGEHGAGEEGGGRDVGGSQGTDLCMCVSLQDDGFYDGCVKGCTALHKASANSMSGTVAKLLALGANAACKDKVRARASMETCSYTSEDIYTLCV